MFGKIDIASIKATLGVDTWVDGEDDYDMTFLSDKMCSAGLSHKEQIEYDALQGLYMSGR